VIDQAIHDILAAASDVTAIVGAKIRPVDADQADAAPFVTFTVTGGESIDTCDGPDEWEKTEFEIGCFAATQLQCVELAAAVKEALHHYEGTIAGVEVGVCLFTEQSGIERANAPGAGKPTFIRTQNYRVLHRTEQPA
jgi:hypothetical protein